MATTKQMFAEIIAKLDKLLEKPKPTGLPSKPGTPKPSDPFIGENSVIQPGTYFPSGMRPDGYPWVSYEQFDDFCKKTGWEPKCK